MALSQSFSDATCDIVQFLGGGQKNPVVNAERVRTRYGETVLLSIRDTTLQ